MLHEIVIFRGLHFSPICYTGFSEPSADNHPWRGRSVRSDPVERDSRGRRKPGEPGSRPGRARSALPNLLGAPLQFRAQPRVFVHDAQDLTQSFFAYLIEKKIYARADRQKGKFRSFLLASLKNFLADAYDREQTLKRGGGHEFLPSVKSKQKKRSPFFKRIPPRAT